MRSGWFLAVGRVARPGRFGKTAVQNKTAVLAGARWVSKTSAAGIALLELNGPDFSLTADA